MNTSFSEYVAGKKAEVVLPWNNVYDLISYETYQRLNLILQCVVKPILSVVGIPSNIVNCVVFWRQGLRDRMNFCLFCLALADLLYLLSLLCVTQIGPLIELVDEMLGKEIYFKSNRYGLAIRDQTRTMASCINLVISIERCVCVYLPLRASSLMKKGTMVKLLASIFVITQVGFVYNFFHYEVVSRQSNVTNKTIYWVAEASKTFKDYYFLFQGVEVFLLTFLPLCIFITIFITTLATVVKLKAALSWREKASSSGSDKQTQQRGLIKMLVIVSCVYIITSTPYVGHILITVFLPGFDMGSRYQNSFLTLAMIATICTEVHCAFNFVIYYRNSSRYRSELKAFFSCTASKVT
ncbi:uncharacterized protein LOC112566574 [Pomacea canaliculata]|uniref:uncharacterized protein LOC112566574 n=1 Tax=Pomacea canaliculata TaxID=400727 RepID=UPI000D731141|nr:uncharacterized protein LOC112566574 [Pomacea canaliculata]